MSAVQEMQQENMHLSDSTWCQLFVQWVVQWLRLALSKGPNRVGVSLPSPKEGNTFSFQNIVYSSI
jgi:hypothetical protein